MLVYETQKWGGFAVLWRVFCKGDLAGSVFPAVMPWACVAASIAGLIKLDAAMEWSMFSSVHDDSLFDATYALQVWATAVGFALVFRSNLAYGRFWEGRGQIAKFSSYMQDTALMAVTYDEANKNMNQYREWKQEILHLFSLLHALGMQCLRGDDNLDNLLPFDPWEGYKQSLGQTEGGELPGSPGGGLSMGGASPGAAAAAVGGPGRAGTGGAAAAAAASKAAKPPVQLAGRARRYSVKPSLLFEQMQAAAAAEQAEAEAASAGSGSGSGSALTRTLSGDSGPSTGRARPGRISRHVSVDVGGVNLVLEPDENSYSNGSGSGRGTRNAASDAKAAGRMRLGGLLEEKVVEEEEEEETDEQKAEKLARAARIRALSGGKRQVSRVAPSKTTCDPVLMTREYDEQFVHPMDSGYVNQAKIASATETFREMDRNMSGQLSKGDLHRVFAQERERHLAATRALAVMAAKEEEEEALRSGMQQQQVGNAAAAAQRSTASSTDDDDDDTKAAAAAAAAAAAVSGSDVTLSPGGGPKRMKKVKRMKKAGEGRDRGRQNRGPPAGGRGSNDGGSPAAAGGGGGGGNEEEPLLLIPPASADSPGGESLSEREVRKLALQSMKVMRIDIGLRTEAQAKLVLDWVGSVPFFQKNAPNEDAMAEISKEVVAETYKEGEDIVVEGETGDAFYAILSGDVDVIVNGKNVGQMTVPQSFGDRALESDDVRGATIRATTEVTCARLTRESYHSSIERVSEAEEAMAHQSESHENAALEESIRIADYAAALMTMGLPLEQRSNVQNRNLEEWVGTITYFKMNARTEQHRIEIAKALQPVYFMDGEEVFHQGDIGDAFFCIMQGEVEIEVDGKSVGTLTPGKCFGDRALEAEEGGEPDRRAATITALGDITLARLSADAYHACIDRVMMAASATPRAATRAEDDLEALAKAAAEHPLSVISGLTNEERIALGGCETFNGSRVLIAQSWVAQAIVRRRHAGGLQVDPPVLATGVFRNFQCANDAYFQCKKIIDTPFPYPYAQAVLLMLCLYTVIAPFMICQIVNSTPWAIAISFITVGILVTMNEVARGLEEPFGSGDESNKIAVDALHMDFNENLWCLTQKVYKRDAWPSQTASAAYPRSKTDQHPRESEQREAAAAASASIPTKAKPRDITSRTTRQPAIRPTGQPADDY